MRNTARSLLAGCLLLVLCACREKAPPAPPPAPPVAPKPLEPLLALPGDAGVDGEREALYHVAPFELRGAPLPADATAVSLEGHVAVIGAQRFDLDVEAQRAGAIKAVGAAVLLKPMGETYLAEVNHFLADLDDARVTIWAALRDGTHAIRVQLKDEVAFGAWVDEAVPGKVRVIQRTDGFEIQTNMGKLPGPDVNGPTVPVRGGKQDLATLNRGLGRVHGRFSNAPDVSYLPSWGTELRDAFDAFSANVSPDNAPIFPETIFVYPRPRKDAGGVK